MRCNDAHFPNINQKSNIPDPTRKKTIYLRFPFINQRFTNKVYRIIERCKFSVIIKPIFMTEKPLSSKLSKNTNIPCPKNCLCGDRRICNTKNLVYEIKCKLCHQIYIGETHRTFNKRITEHIKSNSSCVYHHLKVDHRVNPDLKLIDYKIIKTGFRDILQRTGYEETMIRKIKPRLNVQHVMNIT